MVLELFVDIVPKAAENFHALCIEEKDIGPMPVNFSVSEDAHSIKLLINLRFRVDISKIRMGQVDKVFMVKSLKMKISIIR